MTADPKFFLFFFIQVIYIFTTTSLHPREVNAEHLQTMEENSVSFVYWEPKKSDYFSWKKRKKEGRKTTVSVVVLFLGGNQSRIWNYMERKRTWTRIRHYVSLYVRCIFCNAPYQRKSVRAYQHNRRMEQEHTHTQKNKQIEKTFVFSWSPALLQILSINIRIVTSA